MPTYGERYEFKLSRYLETQGSEFNFTRHVQGVRLPGDYDPSIATIEMHVLPQKEVYEVFRKHHISLIECSEETSADPDHQSRSSFVGSPHPQWGDKALGTATGMPIH